MDLLSLLHVAVILVVVPSARSDSVSNRGMLQQTATSSTATSLVTVPCTSANISLALHTEYILWQCCDTTVSITMTLDVVGSVESGVVIRVEDGCVLPSVVVTEQTTVLSNVSLYIHRVNGAVITSPLFKIQFSNNDNDALAASSIHVAVVNSSISIPFAYNDGEYVGIFVSIVALSISNLSLVIESSVITAQCASQAGNRYTLAALFLVTAFGNAGHWDIRTSNVTLRLNASAMFNRLFSMDVGQNWDMTTATNLTMTVQSCTISLEVDCRATGNSNVGACATLDSDNFLIHFSGNYGNVSALSLLTADTDFSVIVDNDRLGPAVQTATGIYLSGGEWLVGLVLSVQGGSFSGQASTYVSLLRTTWRRMQGATITIGGVAVQNVAQGAMYAQYATRTASLVFFMADSSSYVTLTIVNVTALMSVTSGSAPETIANSSLSAATTDLIYVESNVEHSVFEVSRCVLYADMRNGTMPLLSKVMPLVFGSISTTMVRLYKTHSVMNVTTRVASCQLYARMGLMTAAGALYIFASSTVSLLFPLANCTVCQFSVVNSTGWVLEVEFPKTIGMSALPPENVKMFNLTMVLVAFDNGAYISTLGGLLAALLSSASFFSSFKLAVAQQNVTVIIENSTVVYPLPSVGSVDRRLVSMIPQPNDVLGYYAPPQYLSFSTIRISLGFSTSSSRTTSSNPSSSVVYPLHAIVCTVGCILKDTVVSLRGNQVALGSFLSVMPSSPAALVRSTMRFEQTTVSFPVVHYHDTTLANGSAIFLSGNAPSLSIDEHSSIHVSGSEFSGFRPGSVFVARDGIVWGRDERSSSSLSLGCNVWNGLPLPYDFVVHTVPRHVVSYPRSSWNDTVVCEGFVPTASVTASVPIVVVVPASFQIGSLKLIGLSYVFPQTSVSVAALQRSLQALSLARRCTATGAADAPDDFMADWMSNPLQMHFSSADDGLGWAAGSVVGNVLLIAFLTVVRWLWSSAVAARRSSCLLPVREALRSGFHACGGWVSSYRDAYVALLQPLATATTALAAAPAETRTTGNPWGYALSAVGLVVVFAPTVRWAWVVLIVWSGRFPFVQVKRPLSERATVSAKHGGIGVRACATKVVLTLKRFGRSLDWRLASKPQQQVSDQDVATVHPAVALAYLPIFDELLIARRWYFVVDFAFCVSTGVVAGAASFSDQCAWGEWLLVAISLLNVVVVGLLWPYRSAFSGWSALVNLAFCFAVAILAALPGHDAEASAIVTTLTVVVMLPTALTAIAAVANTVCFARPMGRRELDLVCHLGVPLSMPSPTDSDSGGSMCARRESQAVHSLEMLIRMACQRKLRGTNASLSSQ